MRLTLGAAKGIPSPSAVSSKPVFLLLNIEIVLNGFSHLYNTSIILLNVSVDTVGWSPVTHSAKSEVRFDKPLYNEVDKPTSQGLFIMNLTESL